MAMDTLEAATLGGLDLGRGKHVQLLVMTGELTGLAAAGLTGVLANEGSGLAAAETSITVDTVDATTKVAVGDKLFRTKAADGLEFTEIGTVTSVGATAIGISAGTGVALTNNDPLLVDVAYDIGADGVVTVSRGALSAAAADLSISQGAGQIVIRGVNLDSTTAAADIERSGIALTMDVSFGTSPSSTDSLNIIGAVGSFGWDEAGGTVGSAAVDQPVFGSIVTCAGNNVVFDVGLPYEQEGGAQREVADGSILKFCILAIAKSNGV